MSKLTLVFAAVAVLMLGDLCSASENLPGQDSEEVKRSFFPADYFNKRSFFPQDYFHKRSEEEQHNLEDKRSWFPEEDKRAYIFKRSDGDNSWTWDFYKRSVDDQQNLEKVKRPAGIYMLGKRSWFPEEDKRASWYPYKRSDDNSWTHDFYKRGAGTPYHIIRRSEEPSNADVKDKRAAINLRFSK